jgi:hypothetical protein
MVPGYPRRAGLGSRELTWGEVVKFCLLLWGVTILPLLLVAALVSLASAQTSGCIAQSSNCPTSDPGIYERTPASQRPLTVEERLRALEQAKELNDGKDSHPPAHRRGQRR